METKELQDFISFFTRNKTLSHAQQRKRDILLTRDYSELIELIQELPETPPNVENSDNRDISNIPSSQVGQEDAEQPMVNAEKVPHRPGILQEYISPMYIQKFLRDYNQDDVLKYTCHLIDDDETIDKIRKLCRTEQYDFFKHSELILRRFKQLTWNYREQHITPSPKMTMLITVYLSGNNPVNNDDNRWSSNGIDINWACDEIKKWAEANPHIIPNPGRNIAKKQKNSGFKLQSAFKSKITGKRIKSFSDLVLFFKSQFHIRQDNSLRSLLNQINQKFDSKLVEISFSQEQFNDTVELFTDIDKLIQAYRIIIDMCVENKQSDAQAQIELSFYDDADTKHTYFCIHHLNSVYKKTQKNVVERIGETQANLITNQINGLCDLFVEAVFGDNSYGRFNLWDSEPNLEIQPLEEKIQGVKYIMRF